MTEKASNWTSILRKILYVVLIVLGIFLAFRLAVFYIPFVIAFVLYLLIEPAIKKLMKKFKLSRKLSSIIMFVIVFGTILSLLIWGIVTIVSEATNLLTNFNTYYEKISSTIQNFVSNFKIDSINIPTQLRQILQDTTASLLEKSSGIFQDFLQNLLAFVTSIPTIAIYFAVTILSLYFICTDKIYMIDEIEHHFPERWVKNMAKHLKDITKSLGGYLKSQLTLIGISFVISLIGLYIMSFAGLNVGFPLLIALGIAFVDALPILGSGTVMIPWAIISGINGDLTLGISIIVLLIIMSITRQFLEPKIVSGKIGVHPIFTMIAMYTGFRIIGIFGMLLGPILLIIFKNIFKDFIDGGVVKTIFNEE